MFWLFHRKPSVDKPEVFCPHCGSKAIETLGWHPEAYEVGFRCGDCGRCYTQVTLPAMRITAPD